MAVDFDAIRAKLARLSGANTNRNVTWKPTEGEEHTVRLIAFPDNDGQPFKEIQWYYNIPGARGIAAPFQFGKKDPVQELIAKLREEGSKATKPAGLIQTGKTGKRLIPGRIGGLAAAAAAARNNGCRGQKAPGRQDGTL